MPKKPVIDAAQLRQLLDYNPDTGSLHWRERSRELFATHRSYRAWNARYAGALAFSCQNPAGYMTGQLFGRWHAAHRVVWAWVHGAWPTHQIDHINRIRDDNRLSNLREVTNTENARNQSAPRSSKTGICGVSKLSLNSGKYTYWAARIRVAGKDIRLGTFPFTAEGFEAAVQARKEGERAHGFYQSRENA
jgi:hypothetical protein